MTAESAITLVRNTEDKKAGMTVGDLFQFAQDAIALDIDPRTPIRVTTGWRMQIHKLEAGGKP